ncbi:MAG TPA: hypothetical protein VFD04_04970 [Actinomycetes bacterium]|jgi:hypothetical protein|nr:hypothetical protein [Actinomycetes bacterium]
MRPVRLIAALVSAATVGMLTLAAAPAWAAPTTPPVAVHASPNPVVAGHPVTLSGSVGPDAAGSDCSSLILYSDAFSLTDDVTRAPVYTTAKPSGAFTATATIPRAKPAGTYAIYLRCGGATVGGGRLVVQEAPAVLQVRPRSVTAGDSVTVSGWLSPVPAIAECGNGVTLLSNAFVHTHDFAGVPAIGAAVRPDGTFAVTTKIPRSKVAGTYAITGRCGGGNIGASATLLVRAAPPATTTPAASPPASTVTQPPAPTAAPTVAGPATPAAAHPAGRWILPWLAALAASTLAGLGMWLLYQRRHPASLGR